MKIIHLPFALGRIYMRNVSIAISAEKEGVRVSYCAANSDGTISLVWDKSMSHAEAEQLVKNLIKNLINNRGGAK
jgi:hypothetical protein